jgi:3-deoxy-D-manno-octulosonate 8-phosphate phosphatase (KDO 8-P phosphatase)
MIKLAIFDIDGTLTDGYVTLNSNGKEFKKISYRDIDAFNNIKKLGIKTAIITKESSRINHIIKDKFNPLYYIDNCKDKAEAVTILINLCNPISSNEIAYIGDSENDILGMNLCGMKVCPNNAVYQVKNICILINRIPYPVYTYYIEQSTAHILPSNGGNGAVEDLYNLLMREKNILY